MVLYQSLTVYLMDLSLHLSSHLHFVVLRRGSRLPCLQIRPHILTLSLDPVSHHLAAATVNAANSMTVPPQTCAQR